METFYIAVKSVHPIVAILAVYFYAVAWEKTTSKNPDIFNYLKTVFTWLIILIVAIFVADVVFIGVVSIPTLIRCYQDVIPPPVCDVDTNERIVYTTTFVISVIHIFLDAILGSLAAAVRYEAGKKKKEKVEDEDDFDMDNNINNRVSTHTSRRNTSYPATYGSPDSAFTIHTLT